MIKKGQVKLRVNNISNLVRWIKNKGNKIMIVMDDIF